MILKEGVDFLYGIKNSRDALAISHLIYAYDLMIICRASINEA